MPLKRDISSMRSRILFDICENLRTNSVFSVSILSWFDWHDAEKFFFPFPIIADLIDVRDKSIFFRSHSFLIWLAWRRKVFFFVPILSWFDRVQGQKFFSRLHSFLIWSTSGQKFFFWSPFFPDLNAICKKSVFFRFHSLLIWLPWGRKVFFSVSFCCWFLQLCFT